ncbi:hypothetical protein SAMN03159382_02765 [Pseudomonas sp. NFACC23-1]|nr:hypothetical protein SAMN03159386_02498 [Pseudomonas sp. NFACC17-2]SEJ48600.1 hypothetical protein SAMN03159382_02765 [Pseudomonas sp. NFACC23-1]SFW70863.1 hypothetical protein SAMN05660640_02903 [Pseudomonas sp. NFACC16-2]
MVRGFIPARLRSNRKILGLLRSPAGINPLATFRTRQTSMALPSRGIYNFGNCPIRPIISVTICKSNRNCSTVLNSLSL